MIYLGADHAGFGLKEMIKKYLDSSKIQFEDLGTYSEASCDYALIAEEVARAVVEEKNSLGLLFCGTGVGMSIAANKVKDVRAACCSDCYSAKMTRLHNDANMLCLGSRVIGIGLAEQIVEVFLNTDFTNEERHSRRINQIHKLEK